MIRRLPRPPRPRRGDFREADLADYAGAAFANLAPWAQDVALAAAHRLDVCLLRFEMKKPGLHPDAVQALFEASEDEDATAADLERGGAA